MASIMTSSSSVVTRNTDLMHALTTSTNKITVDPGSGRAFEAGQKALVTAAAGRPQSTSAAYICQRPIHSVVPIYVLQADHHPCWAVF